MENTITSTWLGFVVRLMKATAIVTVIFVLSGILMGLAATEDYTPADATYPVATETAPRDAEPGAALTAADSGRAMAASGSMQ